jgi:hypothetical protein
MNRQTVTDPRKKHTNRIVASVCIAFFGGMIGMAYAAVPLYAMFCKATVSAALTRRATQQYADRVLAATSPSASTPTPPAFMAVEPVAAPSSSRSARRFRRTTARPTSSTAPSPAAPFNVQPGHPARTSTRSSVSASRHDAEAR